MSLSAAVIRELVTAGVTGDALIAACERIEAADRPKNGAERTRKWRENKPGSVTRDVTASHVTSPLILSIDKNTNTDIETSKKVRKRALRPIAPDWEPPRRAFPLAAELGVTVGEVEPRFRDYLSSSGKLYADYDAAFCNFIRNTPRFSARPPPGNGSAPPRPGSKDDTRERTVNALRKLNEFVAAHSDDESGGSSDGPSNAGVIPFAKPARS